MPKTLASRCPVFQGSQLTDFIDSSSRSSIIPLQEEMEMHTRLKARVMAKALNKVNANIAWEEINEAAAFEINKRIQVIFQQALIKAYDGKNINYALLKVNYLP